MNVHVINDLVYTLATSEATIAEARTLLPELLRSGASASLLDTAVGVYRQSGETARAFQCATQAVALLVADVSRTDYLDIVLNAAEIAESAGNRQEAGRMLEVGDRVKAREMLHDPRAIALRRRLASTRL